MKRKYLNKEFEQLKIIKISIIILFLIIIIRLLYLNIYMKTYYKVKINNYTNNYVTIESAPRGRIYDRNYNLLVDNTSVKSIIYEKKNNTTEDEISLAYSLIDKISLDYNKLLTRNLKEFYILIRKEETDKLITKQEYKDLENRKLTRQEIYELKIDRIKEENLNTLEEKDKKAAYLYYLMNKGYYYSKKTIKENCTDEEYAYIIENINKYKGFNVDLEWERKYLYKDTLRTILGNISTKETGIPKEDLKYYLSLGYSMDDRVGISGIEKQYESILKGEKAIYKINDDNSLTLIKEGKKGNDIVLSIDINLQTKAEEILKQEIINTKKEANTEFYNKSFYIISNPKTGEILSLSGKKITDNNKFYDLDEGTMNYSITPGSVVKGASMTVGYKTKVIDIGTTMKDECIKLYNLPEKCSWKTLGTINDLEALQYSSNVYQYKIAMKVGKFDYHYGADLNIDLKAFNIYRNIFYQYGLGTKTGVDYPKEDNGYKGESKAGDLLINFAIGQYDTYTPMQLSQYINTLANNGEKTSPRFLKSVLKNNDKKEILYEVKPKVINKVDIEEKYIKRIQEGFRLVLEKGTGVGYINYKYNPAGKTGTSESFVDVDQDQIVDFETISNNFVGYAPFENPTMSITTSSPDVQNPNRGEYKSDVNYRITRKISDLYFSMYDLEGNLIKS